MAIDADYLNPPKRVKQQKWATCWAAAFESILDATANSNKQTERGGDVRQPHRRQDQTGVLGDIAKDFGFVFNIFLEPKDTIVFSDRFIIERLKQGGAPPCRPEVANLGNGELGITPRSSGACST
jgi:hypothetical protein